MDVFMPGATEWLCRYCNEKFWWHPGQSGAKRPSECACGQNKEPTLIIRLGFFEQRGGNGSNHP
jgi:hypothetical protein